MGLVGKTRESRLAALGLLLVACGILGICVGLPLYGAYERTLSEISRYQRDLDHYRRVLQTETSLNNAIESVEQNRDIEELLLDAGSDSIAVAELHNQLQGIVGATGAALETVEALPPQQEDGHRRLGLRIQFACDINALRNVLYGLEYGRPAMILDNIFIHARSTRAIGIADPLNVRIDVFAFKPGELS